MECKSIDKQEKVLESKTSLTSCIETSLEGVQIARQSRPQGGISRNKVGVLENVPKQLTYILDMLIVWIHFPIRLRSIIAAHTTVI